MELAAMDLLRHVRRHANAAGANGAGGLDDMLEKRLTPQQLSSIQAAASASAAALASAAGAGGAAGAGTQTTSRGGANPATLGTTLAASRTTVPNTYSQVQAPSSIVAPAQSSSASAITSSAPSSATTTSARSSSAVTSTSTYSVPIPHTVTAAVPSSSAKTSISATPVATTADRVASSSSSSLSTGAVVGIVLAVLVGTVALGSLLGFFYRKVTNRGYGKSAPWSKIQDDDITPFSNEKPDALVDDYYGQAAAPVIGSRRALAMARQNAYEDQPEFRPQSEYYANRAGVGAGTIEYGAYPTMSRNAPDHAYQYGVDAQGRPYNAQAGRVPMMHTMQDQYPPTGRTSPPSSRQLLGPGGAPHPYATAQPVNLMPVPLGRPAAPNSHADLMRHEDFADELPTPMPFNYEEDSYTPRTAKSMNEWAGAAVPPSGRSQVSPTSATRANPFDAAPAAGNMRLPSMSFEPLSPLVESFASRRTSQPLPMYEDESVRQKALYGQVAKAAGVAEPITPKTPGAGLSNSTSSSNSYNTTTSFGAAEPVPRLPLKLTTAPYQHGQPLSPLEEVPTPASNITAAAAPPYTREVNPFDRLPVPSTRTLVAPHSASSGIPSPAFPPPSPGGMSVPGSVTDSPRRWSGPQTPAAARGVGRGVSVYDSEDAYGGI